MAEYRNPFREILSSAEDEEGPGITLTRGQLNAWAGRTLTDRQVDELEDAIPNSSIPEAIAVMSSHFIDEEDDDDA